MNLKTNRGHKYYIEYHLVWTTKDKSKVITNEIESYFRDIAHKQSVANNFSITKMNIQKNYIHMLINCTPQHFIPNVIKALKGNTARLLFKQFPDLKEELRDGVMWNSSYLVCTPNENINQQISEFLLGQQTRVRKRGRPFKDS